MDALNEIARGGLLESLSASAIGIGHLGLIVGGAAVTRFAVQLRDPAWELLYGPAQRLIGRLADRFEALQHLSIRRYLALAFATLILLLVVVVLAR